MRQYPDQLVLSCQDPRGEIIERLYSVFRQELSFSDFYMLPVSDKNPRRRPVRGMGLVFVYKDGYMLSSVYPYKRG